MFNSRHIIIFAFLFLGYFFPRPANAWVMYMIEGLRSKAIIIGTVHLWPASAGNVPDVADLHNMLRASRKIIFESDFFSSDIVARRNAILERQMGKNTISSLFENEIVNELKLRISNLPVDRQISWEYLEHIHPWNHYVALSCKPTGPFSASLVNIDNKIYETAVKLKIPIDYIESIEDQFQSIIGNDLKSWGGVFRNLPMSQDECNDGRQDILLKKISAAYLSNDAKTALNLSITNNDLTWMKKSMKQRNASMTARIEHELSTSGVITVAVGWAHLFGDDGIIAELSRKGYTAIKLANVPFNQ